MSDDLDALFDMLGEAGGARTTYAHAMDRYRDFRQTFLATDAGQRVLKEILVLGRMNRSSAARGDPHETYLREGERNLAMKIFNIAHVEPQQRPTQQQSTDPET